MEDVTTNKRKVKTRDGCFGLVFADFGLYCSVQIRRGGYYKVYAKSDLEDVTDEDFRRGFR